jgi:cytochrome c
MKTVLAIGLLAVSLNSFAQPASLNQCMACHQVDKKVVGPSFKDISAKYKNRPDAVAYLSQSIKNGGGGKWGAIPMPAQKQLTDAQAKELAEWIFTK